MSTEPNTTGIPPDLQEDAEAILEYLAGKPLDSETCRCIRERGDRIREQILREHGILDIGVPAIRELRDD
jgi:hypothetical protein